MTDILNHFNLLLNEINFHLQKEKNGIRKLSLNVNDREYVALFINVLGCIYKYQVKLSSKAIESKEIIFNSLKREYYYAIEFQLNEVFNEIKTSLVLTKIDSETIQEYLEFAEYGLVYNYISLIVDDLKLNLSNENKEIMLRLSYLSD